MTTVREDIEKMIDNLTIDISSNPIKPTRNRRNMGLDMYIYSSPIKPDKQSWFPFQLLRSIK